MRIVGGTARGRKLRAPDGDEVTRPTADRVRQTVFDVLGQSCEGLQVLDLYAGTGALGLEAASRGAAGVVLVDSSREAAGLCRDNVALLGFRACVEVFEMPVERAIAELVSRKRRFELVFSDPPYALRAGASTLAQVMPVAASGAVVVLEHERRESIPATVGAFVKEDERRFGSTLVSIFRLTDPAP
jgi:16S rRNA (guanine(966)-N(2))-methyltransferase RsmD